MSEKTETTFDSIESAHEFVTLLAQTVAQAKQDIERDVEREQNVAASRRLHALRISVYTLQKLELHISRSCRALNDLRTLRRLLFDERSIVPPSSQLKSSRKSPIKLMERPRTAASPLSTRPAAMA